MKLASVATILDGGGRMAVNAHGYLRSTKDADLAVDLAPANSEV